VTDEIDKTVLDPGFYVEAKFPAGSIEGFERIVDSGKNERTGLAVEGRPDALGKNARFQIEEGIKGMQVGLG